MSASSASPAPRVVLFTRTGCHLCAPARELVALVTEAAGARWTEVDIDSGPDSTALTAQYGELVPVVTVDGVVQGYWRLDDERLRRALAAGPPQGDLGA